MIRAIARLGRLLALVRYFLVELVASSLKVAWDVVTPRHRASPGILAVPLDVSSETAMVVLVNLVSLTPGSLSLDVSPDRNTLYVHFMFLDDVERARDEIRRMQRMVKEAVE